MPTGVSPLAATVVISAFLPTSLLESPRLCRRKQQPQCYVRASRSTPHSSRATPDPAKVSALSVSAGWDTSACCSQRCAQDCRFTRKATLTRTVQALGCGDISAISRTRHKMKDAITMGASVFIATDDDPDWEKLHSQTLDIIVSTVSSTDMPIDKYLQLLRVDGHFIQLGEPEDKFPAFEVFALIQKRLTISGSCIGSPREVSVGQRST
jgi:hypothetical protein